MPETERLLTPLIHDERLAQEVLAKAGPAYAYQRTDYKNDISTLSNDLQNCNLHTQLGGAQQVVDEYEENNNDLPLPTYSMSSSINQDPSPLRIVKPNNSQNIVYKQQVNIRYLQPPTPPPPAPIIIREKQIATPPVQPPIIIRLVSFG